MSQPDDLAYQLDTLAIRTGHNRTFESEHSEPIFLTSSFVCENAADAAAKFSGEIEGNTYSRYTNPTVQAFEKRLAVLDGAERAVATSSGMAAVHAVTLAYLKAGDHVVCSRAVFGSIISLFEKYVMKFGVDVTFVDLEDLDSWKQAIRPNTRLLFIETPSNPLAQVGDLQAIADIAHAHGALFAVDNTFCTPVLQQPLKFGADLIIYSSTKYIDGQGRALGGAVVGKDKLVEEINSVIRTLGKAGAIFHFHAKDTKIDKYNTAVNGVLDTKPYGDEINRSWVFRTVGYGHDSVFWKDLVDNLRLVGYDRVLSIEHEDSIMTIDEGLQKAVAFLKGVCIFEEKPTTMSWA